MKEDRHHRLARIAERQEGVFSRGDAAGIGIGDASLFNGVDQGRYRQVLPGVYAVAGSPRSLRQLMIAGVLSFPTLAAISHRTAAELWRMTDRGVRNVDVVTKRWDRVRRTDLSVHESLDLVEGDVVLLDGLPVTTAVRTVVDLGAESPWDVERALETGVRKGLFTLSEVEAMVKRVARKGRRGVGVIRPLLEARRRWDNVTESALEDLFMGVVCDLGLPQPRSQYVVRDDFDAFVCRSDFAYPTQRLLIELDSEAHHMDRTTFRLDRSKQNRAVALGWNVLRYTWWDLMGDPHKVGTEIRSSLAAPAPR